MAIISTKDLDIYFERSTPRANGPLLFIGGTGGDLRNKLLMREGATPIKPAARTGLATS